MNTTDISSIFKFYLNEETQDIKRCAVGIGNQVYIVECKNGRYIFRCSIEKDAYKDTVYWLKKGKSQKKLYKFNGKFLPCR